MKYILMRIYCERSILKLDLFDYKTCQNIELHISTKYWVKKTLTVTVVHDILYKLSIERIAHSLDEWLNIIMERVAYENRT